MKAPTKQSSMKATKRAERRVDPSRKSVTIAHAPARTETMKRTRTELGVSSFFSW
jgi:hypothetical protein